MTFLNATLLFGTLAVALPIALHLLGRREPKRVQFPAVRFLTQRLKSNRRRMQVKRWALLALRVLLLGLLALALAQPQIHRAVLGEWVAVGGIAAIGCITLAIALWAIAAQRAAWLRWGLLLAAGGLLVAAIGWGARTIAGGPQITDDRTAPAAVAFLIDNGPTSGYGLSDASSELSTEIDDASWRLGRAREAALWLLGQYPLESRFALLDRSARPAAFALDPAAVQRGLRSLAPLQSTRPLAERIETAIRLLRTSEIPLRKLYIFTDLTESSWEVRNETTNVTSLIPVLSQEPYVSVQIIDVGDEAYQNRSLGNVEIVDTTPPRNVPVSIATLLTTESSNGGTSEKNTSTPNQPVEATFPASSEITVQARLFEQQPGFPLERDGQTAYPRLRTVDRKTIKLAGAGERVNLTLPPLEFGTHHGIVEFSVSDSLPVDDVRYFTLEVQKPDKILLMCDDAPERKVLSAMLSPYGNNDPRREYDVDFATDRTLSDFDLNKYSAIGLFNPRVPVSLVQDDLQAWVEAGGNLFVAIGNSIDSSGSGESVDWPLIGNPKRIWRVPEPGTFAQMVQPNHPSLAALNSAPGGAPWSAFRVFHYWQIGEEAQFSELLRFAGTEHLALGEKRLGQGRIILLTTPLPAVGEPTNQWNDLLASSLTNAWDVYLILLRQIFEDLTGGFGETFNYNLGEPVALKISEQDATSYQLFAPGQPPVQIDVADQIILPGPALIAGNYWLRGSGGSTAGYSANLMKDATSLQRISRDVLDQVLGKDQYELVTDTEDIELAKGQASQSRPLFQIIMLILLAIFVLEQVLSNRFYASADESNKASLRKRVTSDKEPVVAA